MDAALIAAGTRLVVIGRAGVGVDNVDLDAATRAGITVVNAPTGNTIAAAEHTLALLYGVARRIAAADASVRRGEWKRAQFTGLELRGRTIGIVGLGKIGLAIALRARAMEMTVIGVDPFVSVEQAANHGVELVEFDAMLERADVVTVHVPMTRTTKGLIGRDAIARMKPGTIVLNVARGGILDEAAVADALRSGHLGGAGVDVFETEPPTGSPLLDAPNTLLTPHLGASTAEAQILVSEEVAAQIIDVLAGRSARYAVNAPLLTPETARAIAPYLPLAETLGQFFAQFSRGGVQTMTLEIAGELAAYDGAPLTAAVLRGLLETSITERVNLVNAMALAKARGITIVERRTPGRGRVLGAVDPVRRDPRRHDHGRRHGRRRGIASHAPRRLPPGHGAGRVDAHHPPHGPAGDGRADRADPGRRRREHQCDAAGTLEAARRGLDVPGPRRRSSRRRSWRPSGRTRPSWTSGPSGSGRTTERARLADPRRPGRRARPRPSWPVPPDRGGPLPGPDGLAVDGARAGPGGGRRAQDRGPTGPSCLAGARPTLPSRSSTRRLSRTTSTAAAIAAAMQRRGAGIAPRSRCAPNRASSRSPRASGKASIGTDIAARHAATLAAWRRRPWETVAPGGETLQAVAARVGPALAVTLATLAHGREAGTLDRSHVAGYGDAAPDHPWSVVVGHDGVFKIALLTLFGLPLERFWMWSMDLCGLTVVEFRAGRPVLRAHNLTDHLGAVGRSGVSEPAPPAVRPDGAL